MNILYLTNHLDIGGITTYCLSLARALVKNGHNIYIASSGGECVSKFTDAGVKYIPIPILTKKEISPKIISSFLKLKPVIKNEKIDIVHANSRTTQILGCLLSRNTHVPYVYTCHGFFQKRILRFIFPCWGDKTIAISEQVKEHLIDDFKVNAQKISVIHNGIDLDKFSVPSAEYRAQSKKALGLGNAPVIGIVARLSDVKGHVYLIYAMRDILKKDSQAQLLIVGDGREKQKIEKLINELKLKNNVVLIPSTANTASALAAMDIFVLPSLKEGLGLSLMEAMLMGLPVIGSDIGGIRTLIKDGVNGLLVTTADSQAIAEAILDLLGNPDKAARLGQEAARFIAQNFSVEKMITKTEAFYADCLPLKR